MRDVPGPGGVLTEAWPPARAVAVLGGPEPPAVADAPPLAMAVALPPPEGLGGGEEPAGGGLVVVTAGLAGVGGLVGFAGLAGVDGRPP